MKNQSTRAAAKRSGKSHSSTNDSSKPPRRGRPKGSRNIAYKPESRSVSVRAELDDATAIEGLLAKGWMLARRKLAKGQILRQALEEYVAAREPQRNKLVNKFNQPPGRSNQGGPKA